MGVESQGISASIHRYKVIPRTLLFVTNNPDVLLLKGAPDKKLWANLYNGVGGHIESNETVLEATLREAEEEVGLSNLKNILLCGLINIQTDNSGLGIMIYVFKASSPTRMLKHSNEGTAHWVDWKSLPQEEMVSDLPSILPRVLSAKPGTPPFYAKYWYDEHDNLQISFTESA